MKKEIWNLYEILKSAWQRNLPSAEHKRAWMNFEKICHYRANISFTGKVVYQILFIALG